MRNPAMLPELRPGVIRGDTAAGVMRGLRWQMMSDTWLVLDSGSGAADFNMALDEALLETAAGRARPVLRFYSWTPGAATFGYSQCYREIERLTRLRPLIRRPTGGGLVPHEADWTYSLVFPPSHWWHALRAPESYERLHFWIRHALRRIGVPTELSPGSWNESSGECFVGAERNDLLWRGQKIAGAAQRRNRLGLLIQGSIQPISQSLARADWQKELCAVAAELWRIEWETLPFEGEYTLRARELARAKYGRSEYNENRWHGRPKV